MSKLLIALTPAATAFAVAAIPVSASPGATCARYASKAVEQQGLNLRRHCGFVGPRWHTWWDAHLRPVPEQGARPTGQRECETRESPRAMPRLTTQLT